MYTRLTTIFPASFSIICLILVFSITSVDIGRAHAEDQYKISDISTKVHSDGFTMTINGDAPPAYTVSERFDPFRVIIDIAKAEFDASIQLEKILPENNFSKLHLSVLKDQTPPLARFEFTVNENIAYDVQRIKNGLEFSFSHSEATNEEKSSPSVAKQDPVAEKIFSEPGQVDLLEPASGEAQSEIEKYKDSFSLSGYKKERISVDFYKIDLHNVFRLFRQISPLNIIVDEAVQGSITLALNDVPWDFALDVIMNLADLKKEERFNTIVIYPKDKEFAWPQNAGDNLSLEVDVEAIQEEALIIEQSTNQPVEIMQAKQLLIKAKSLEKIEDYEEVAFLYEQALKLWPENSKISNKLANIYLGRLNMNAKAYYFATKTLEKNPSDFKAALYAAISAANMERLPEAVEFFNQSVSGNPPMKEALVSYAAFSEKNNKADIALKLLNTYSDHYGDTVHTMVSKARILDKSGKTQQATEQYRALLSSGFQMRPDLKRYVEERVSQ